MDELLRMHTAEHILTAVMTRRFGCSGNLEMHLGTKKTKCDYDVNRPVLERDIEDIEAAVNAVIAADLAVSTSYVTRSETKREYPLGRVPAEINEIRIVCIEGFDETPCSGIHVQSTREIGRFVIRSWSMRDASTVRIRFGLDTA